MRKFFVLTALLVIVFCPTANSQVKFFGSKEETIPLCDQFMRSIVALDVQGAFKLLKPYFKVSSEEEFAKLQLQTINQLDTYTQRFGYPLGYEKIQEKKISDLLIQYSYVEKYESNLLRWSFVFYKPQDKWVFQSLSWDENIPLLFE